MVNHHAGPLVDLVRRVEFGRLRQLGNIVRLQNERGLMAHGFSKTDCFGQRARHVRISGALKPI
ncbi:hypothetical protein SIL87_00185 [Acidiphilium acidophilum]|uniref:Uncharacterized protein n=1 Tax=Acidiphilium acidophilum TaxID=76588 RepID=A0AAW9DJL8_ACIAO|nr:hypothetical protein [Acidiphilium acidophilum]